MNELPASWVVQHRAGLWSRLTLAYGALIGAFLALVALGGAGFAAWGLWQGTLPPPDRRTTVELMKVGGLGLVGLLFGGVMLRTSVGSLLDLFGAELTIEGRVDELEVRTTSGRPSLPRAVVAGEEVELPFEVFPTLAQGQRVWLRVGRFERGLKVLARPPEDLPRT